MEVLQNKQRHNYSNYSQQPPSLPPCVCVGRLALGGHGLQELLHLVHLQLDGIVRQDLPVLPAGLVHLRDIGSKEDAR